MSWLELLLHTQCPAPCHPLPSQDIEGLPLFVPLSILHSWSRVYGIVTMSFNCSCRLWVLLASHLVSVGRTFFFFLTQRYQWLLGPIGPSSPYSNATRGVSTMPFLCHEHWWLYGFCFLIFVLLLKILFTLLWLIKFCDYWVLQIVIGTEVLHFIAIVFHFVNCTAILFCELSRLDREGS